MATWGWDTPNWTSGWVFYGFNTENNVSSGVANFPPPGGTVTAIVFNCALLSGSGGPMSAQGCLWSASGALLVAGSAVSLPGRGAGPGPYAWQTSTCSYAASSGQAMAMGWWRSPANAAGDNLIGYGVGGASLLGTTAGSTSPGAFSHDSNLGGTIGVYVIYTPGTAPPAPAPPPPPAAQNVRRANVYELMREGLLPK